MIGLFAILDTMRFIAADVATICVGQAASAAAVLLAAGAPGKRYTLPNARVLIHQPHGGAQGQSTDMELAVAEMVEMRRRMVDVLVESTGQPRDRITADIDRDYIVRGEQAIGYGLVDQIIDRRTLASGPAHPALPAAGRLNPPPPRPPQPPSPIRRPCRHRHRPRRKPGWWAVALVPSPGARAPRRPDEHDVGGGDPVRARPPQPRRPRRQPAGMRPEMRGPDRRRRPGDRPVRHHRRGGKRLGLVEQVPQRLPRQQSQIGTDDAANNLDTGVAGDAGAVGDPAAATRARPSPRHWVPPTGDEQHRRRRHRDHAGRCQLRPRRRRAGHVRRLHPHRAHVRLGDTNASVTCLQNAMITRACSPVPLGHVRRRHRIRGPQAADGEGHVRRRGRRP